MVPEEDRRSCVEYGKKVLRAFSIRRPGPVDCSLVHGNPPPELGFEEGREWPRGGIGDLDGETRELGIRLTENAEVLEGKATAHAIGVCIRGPSGP